METERVGLCGPIHDKNPDREAVRGGTTPSSVVLGARRVPIHRPRVQAMDGSGEVELETFRVVSNPDLLEEVAVERMLAGLATRRYKPLGERAGRCQLHKRRNVKNHLPRAEQSRIDQRLAAAFAHPDPDQGLANARSLAAEIEHRWPDAAGSIGEGLEEMFTVRRLGVDGALFRTLWSTNPIESMISIARDTSRNVKTVARRGHTTPLGGSREAGRRTPVSTSQRPPRHSGPRRSAPKSSRNRHRHLRH